MFLKVGDLIKLKSGGPVMTVTAVNMFPIPAAGGAPRIRDLEEMWYNGSGYLCSTFSPMCVDKMENVNNGDR